MMAQTKSNGTIIRYDDLGHGEPVLLFLPGWCANRTVFKSLTQLCSTYRRCLALDWRGHGESGTASTEFGSEGLVEDALAVINASRGRHIVPVALAHAGWVAIELRRRLLGQIPRIIFLEWLVQEPPPSFLESLEGMQSQDLWRQTVDQIFDLWLHRVDNPELARFIHREMGAYPYEMWARAARSIGKAYAEAGSPLQALSRLAPPVPVLHLYATPKDDGFQNAQEAFAASHPWFRFHRLEAHSHFPMFEVPEVIALAIEAFVNSASQAA
jgi:pimeloyl-ACP methyl ester carboxylesterase